MTTPEIPSLSTDRAPRAVLLLGWAGLIPMVAGAAALFVTARSPVSDTRLVLPLLAYGAIVLSFLGGVRWGLAFFMRDVELQARALAFGIVPALVAWVSVALASQQVSAFLLLIGAHGVQGWYDVTTATRGGAPPWYARLRLRLTLAAMLALATALIALVTTGRAS